MSSFAHSAQISSLLGIFMKSMERDLGFGRTAVSGVQTLARLVEAFLAPFLGPLVDKGWGKRLMLGGALIAGGAYLMLSQVQSLWQLYLIKGVIAGVGLAGFGQLVVLVAVSNWFVAKRGRALGITAMGASVGSLTMIPLLTFFIAATSWRWGWGFLGIMIWVTVLLPAFFLMVRRPEDIGLLPDGRIPGAEGADGPLSVESEETVSSTGRRGMRGIRGTARGANEDVLWSRRDVLMTRTFWLLTFTLGLSHTSMQAINLHLIPYIEDMGHATTLGAMAITARSAMSLVGSPMWGFAAERWEPRYLVSFKFLLYATGIFVLMNATSPVAIFSAVLIYGTGMAGTNVMVEVMWANYYGRLALGMVRGMGMPFMTGVSAVGPLIAGVIYDATNSYNVAFIAIIAGSVASAVLILFCTYPKRPAARFQTPAQVD